MHKIEYEIQLNEDGRPYIELSVDYDDKPDDKFFVIELTRYFLQNIYANKRHIYDENTIISLDNSIRLLGQISDEMAHIIHDGMIAGAEIEMMFHKYYHVKLKTIEERDSNDTYVFDSKIFKKIEGLKVFIEEDSEVFLYTNNEWKKINNEV